MGFTKKINEKRGKTSLSYTKDYEKRKNKTRKNVKGGMLPIILIENAPLIISGVGAAFNLIIKWVITANKTIDNYRAVEKLSTTVLTKKPKAAVGAPVVAPVAAAKKPVVAPVVAAAPKKPVVVAAAAAKK